MASRDLVDVEYLSQFFHLPITEASKELGICATALKKICRKHGIPRWPARKIRSIDKIIAALQDSLEQSPHDENVSNELDRLKKRRTELIQNPSLAAAPDERRISKISGSRRGKKNKDTDDASESSPDASASSPPLKAINGPHPALTTSTYQQTTASIADASAPRMAMPMHAGIPMGAYLPPYAHYPMMYPGGYPAVLPPHMYAPSPMMYPPPPDGVVRAGEVTNVMHPNVTAFFLEQHNAALASLANNPSFLTSPEAYIQHLQQQHQQLPNESFYRYPAPPVLHQQHSPPQQPTVVSVVNGSNISYMSAEVTPDGSNSSNNNGTTNNNSTNNESTNTSGNNTTTTANNNNNKLAATNNIDNFLA